MHAGASQLCVLRLWLQRQLHVRLAFLPGQNFTRSSYPSSGPRRASIQQAYTVRMVCVVLATASGVAQCGWEHIRLIIVSSACGNVGQVVAPPHPQVLAPSPYQGPSCADYGS